MKKFNPFDFFFILRPLILIPVWDFFLIGCYRARGFGGFTSAMILGLVIYTMVMGGVYILNQIMDLETDRINRKLFLISGGYVSVRTAAYYMSGLWLLSVVLSYWFGLAFMIFIAISLVLGACYSLPPVKLKGKPMVDTLANSIGYGMVNFGLGWLVFKGFDWSIIPLFLPYTLSIAAVFVNTTLVDMEGDRQAGDRTTAVFLGKALSYILSTLLMAAAVVVAAMRKELICLIPAAASLPLFIFAALFYFLRNRIPRKLTIISFRLPGLLFTLITGYLYWPYLVFLIMLFVAMRVYYKKRFGMNYPTLAGG
jgi:4-hydroxybenzoate polyprenyltransferase